MAKEKKGKSTSIPQKNVHLRLAYLHQAASHISKRMQKDAQRSLEIWADESRTPEARSQTVNTQPRYLINQMKGVSRKSVIRLHKDTKRSVCKKCDNLLTEGNVLSEIENKSKNTSKPWADVLVIKCKNCGTSKRFPMGASCLEQKPAEENNKTAGASPLS